MGLGLKRNGIRLLLANAMLEGCFLGIGYFVRGWIRAQFKGAPGTGLGSVRYIIYYF